MSITLLTLSTASRAPALIPLKASQPVSHRTAMAGKGSSIRIGEWVEGEAFRVAISRGGNGRSGPLKLYF
jgi:hypothetical protein